MRNYTDEQRAEHRLTQTRIPEITEYETFVINEKIARVKTAEMAGLANRPDDEIYTEYVKMNKKETKTELFREIDRSNKNLEIPEVEAYVDQGTAHTNDLLTKMEKGLLREGRTYGETVLAFHKRSSSDMEKQSHLKEETIQGWLNCDTSDANTISDAWRRLGLNKSTALKMVFGYNAMPIDKYISTEQWINNYPGTKQLLLIYKTKPTIAMQNKPFTHGEHKKGLQATSLIMAKYFEDLADILDMPTEPELEEHDGLMWIESDINNSLRERLKEGQKAQHIITEAEKDEDTDEDDEPNEPTINEYGMHKLHHGREGCDDKLLMRINNADHETIQKIQRLLLPQTKINMYGNTYKVKAKYSYMTYLQKSQLWRYISDRKAKLAKIYEKSAPEDIKSACEIMRDGATYSAKKFLRPLNKADLSKYDWLLTYIRFNDMNKKEE